MYSIIIPYRDRREHLQTLLPVLLDKFKDKEYEIIIAEQNDNEKFRLSSLYNIGAQNSQGDVIIFHDVDYIPSDNVDYTLIDNQPTYPVKQVIFLDKDNKHKLDEEIPAGYRNFKYDVGQHWGGVFMLSREHFDSINGFNPLYVGWGKEEEETRLRLIGQGYQLNRKPQGLFYALDHNDNCPPSADPDFINNHKLLFEYNENVTVGVNELTAVVEEYFLEGEMWENVKWLKIKDFEVNN